MGMIKPPPGHTHRPVQGQSYDAAAGAFGASVHRLSVYDGRRLTGFVLDADKPGGRGLTEANAYDAEHRPLGTFRNRREAMGAIHARDVFETQTRASSGNITDAPLDKMKADGRAAASAWTSRLSLQQRKGLSRSVDWQGGDGRTRIAPDASSGKAAAVTAARTKRKTRAKPRLGVLSTEAASGFVSTSTLIKGGRT